VADTVASIVVVVNVSVVVVDSVRTIVDSVTVYGANVEEIVSVVTGVSAKAVLAVAPTQEHALE
jgi:hypothetical protein